MPKTRPNPPRAAPRDALAADCTAQPCPLACKPITQIRVVAVACGTDHRRLRDHAADWRFDGKLYPKPEWTVGGGSPGAPVTHSMAQPIELTVTLEVEPANACVEPGTFGGSGADGIVFAPVAVSFRAGRNVVRVRSSAPLPRAVRRLQLAVDWTAAAASGTFRAQTASWLLLTMADPIVGSVPEDGVTLKRMLKSIDLVQAIGSLDPHTIVAGLMKPLKYYTLERNPAVPAVYGHPQFYNAAGGAWALGGEYPSYYGECQAIVRFVHAVINQIGCPGHAEAVVVWADPDLNGGASAIESPYGQATLHNRSRRVGGRAQSVALAATREPLEVGRLYRPGSMMNMYEACLKFTHGGVTKYYGGGAGIYDTPDAVLKAFAGLVWYTREVQPDGNILNRIQEVVARYGTAP